MSDSDAKLRRRLLRPLAHGGKELVDKAALSQALDRLHERAYAEHALSELRPRLKKGLAQRRRRLKKVLAQPRRRSRQDPTEVRQYILLTKLLYASRRITKAKYVFLAYGELERVHEERMVAGEYSAAFQAVEEEMRRIEKMHGLREDQFWPVGQGPEEYNQLSREYDAIWDAKFVELLREYELDDLAELAVNQADEFDDLRERGRRSVFHKDEFKAALRDVVLRFEEEAARAALAGAYTAAIICLGSATEALLILRCAKSPVKARRTAENLPNRLRVKKGRDPRTWPFITLVEVCFRAGWLPTYQTEYALIDSSDVAELLRNLRNYVHPNRLVEERPWLEADERDYNDARAFYAVVAKALGRVGGRRRERDRP